MTIKEKTKTSSAKRATPFNKTDKLPPVSCTAFIEEVSALIVNKPSHALVFSITKRADDEVTGRIAMFFKPGDLEDVMSALASYGLHDAVITKRGSRESRFGLYYFASIVAGGAVVTIRVESLVLDNYGPGKRNTVSLFIGGTKGAQGTLKGIDWLPANTVIAYGIKSGPIPVRIEHDSGKTFTFNPRGRASIAISHPNPEAKRVLVFSGDYNDNTI